MRNIKWYLMASLLGLQISLLGCQGDPGTETAAPPPSETEIHENAAIGQTPTE